MMYFKYLHYLLLHKWYVGQECWRRGLYWRAIMHDWSKFLPNEFIPYARYFYGPQPDINQPDDFNYFTDKAAHDKPFDRAWLAHQHRQPHHWQHWALREDSGGTKVLQMPYPVCMEMVSDWIGAGRAINRTTPDPADPCKETRRWYLANKNKMLLHPETRKMVETELCMYKEKDTDHA